MTEDERQALREKHTYLGDYCGFCTKDGGYPADYPCDVIKVLDVLEAIAMETTQYLQDFKIVPENIIDNIIKVLDGVNES